MEPNVEAVNGAGQTALMLAITNEHNDTAKILLKWVVIDRYHMIITWLSHGNRHGAQNSRVDSKGETVFHMAARNMDTRCMI